MPQACSAEARPLAEKGHNCPEKLLNPDNHKMSAVAILNAITAGPMLFESRVRMERQKLERAD
ncbi:MAG: hypothetical protein CMM01_26590 [Rhodopirellula sp.]|nr:hypothetical protein [Rhodopirellula sp.]